MLHVVDAPLRRSVELVDGDTPGDDPAATLWATLELPAKGVRDMTDQRVQISAICRWIKKSPLGPNLWLPSYPALFGVCVWPVSGPLKAAVTEKLLVVRLRRWCVVSVNCRVHRRSVRRRPLDQRPRDAA
jgi:hypothetical protein